MAYYYQIQPKEFSQLFLPFSRNATSLEKWLSFSLTKEQSENIGIYFNSKPRSNYRLPSSTERQKTPIELFIQKSQNFLESTFSFYDNFSIYIPIANKNKDYNFAAAFEEGLIKIKRIFLICLSLILKKSSCLTIIF